MVRILPRACLIALFLSPFAHSADPAPSPLISFFFSTCVPCIKEVPFLNEFRRKHAEYNYVAVTFDPVAEARGFAAQRNFEWPIVADAMKFIDAAGVNGYPTYMLVAVDGRILARNSGLSVEALKDPATGLAHIENWVASALAQKH